MSPNQPIDGKRGSAGLGGWWIDHEEAKLQAMDEEWWKSTLPDGTKVDERQYENNGPKDKPFWCFKNGDMYLGPWKKDDKGKTLEAGFGICYNSEPKRAKGKCYLGDFKDGKCHGFGRSFWLKASPIWEKNHLPKSEIKENLQGNRGKGLPYEYVGSYKEDVKEDKHATATLKDGTKKYGTWKNNKPVVRSKWWKDHHDDNGIVTDANPVDVATKAAKSQEEKKTRAKQALAAADKAKKKRDEKKQKAKAEAVETEAKEKLKRECERECELKAAARVEKERTAQIAATRKKGKERKAKAEVKLKRERESEAGARKKEKERKAKKAKLEREREEERKPIVTPSDNNVRNGDDIASFLERDAIGYGAERTEMKKYAENLVNIEGCHSVQFIKMYCEDQDVDGWTWMKPMHRKAFKKWLIGTKATRNIS
jgi:hypothetical protein